MSTYKLKQIITICALLFATALPTLSQSIDGGIEPFIKMRWPGGATLSPDQTLYYTFNPEGIRQLYKVPAGKTQKDAIKLTTFEDGIGGYSLSEDGKTRLNSMSIPGATKCTSMDDARVLTMLSTSAWANSKLSS